MLHYFFEGCSTVGNKIKFEPYYNVCNNFDKEVKHCLHYTHRQ